MENQEEYLDEQIIALRNEFLRSQFQDIHGEVFIKGQPVRFEPVTLFEAKMAILLPGDFRAMDPVAVRMKYPSEDRPQIIMTNQETGSDFTFSLLQDEIVDTDIKAVKDAMKNAIKQVHPATVFMEDETAPLNQTQVGYFTFSSFALGGKIYNLMLVTKIDQRLLIGIFNCADEEKEDWRNPAYQMMMSIEDLTLRGCAE